MQLMDPTAGELIFDGRTVGSRDLPLKDFRRQVQMVFQDSYASLNPRLTIEDSVAFGPQVHGCRARRPWPAPATCWTAWAWRRPLCRALPARAVRRPAPARQHRPRAGPAAAHGDPGRGRLGPGQIGRSPGAEPAADLKREFGLTYVFISHDLNVVHYISDRVMVMYLGQVAEIGPSDALFAEPAHPYTKALLSSVPSMDPPTAPSRRRWRATRPTHQPTQRLPLSPRCPKADAVCAQRCPASPRCSCTTARCLMHEPAAAIRWPRRPAAFPGCLMERHA
jgi:peptide/nickel transport system ATP-binding protein